MNENTLRLFARRVGRDHGSGMDHASCFNAKRESRSANKRSMAPTRCRDDNTSFRGAMYIVGGETPDDDCTNDVLRYAPARGEWRRLRPLLPAGDDGRVADGAAVVHGQNLYVVGGWKERKQLISAVSYYNLETRQAQPPRRALTGGFRTPSVRRPSRSASCRPKSPAADERSCADIGVLLQEQSHLVHEMSVPRAYCAAGVLGGALVVAGGHETNSVELYDLAAGQWRAGPALPENRAYAGAAVL
ncbi:Kelch domain-containing protein 8B [Eumeta japonica]|uniref:Kelch domain-containing protein 8B n=1 Tax=Eumeta variegata TaxID=151549 RepID=A0A4C1VF74_EUMVA|nr:Kelch domain-containing protein 8B [Eumeta japonica]